MVQSGNPPRQGDFFPATREPNWHPIDRSFVEPSQDGRFNVQHSSLHSRALSIEAALRDCVRLPVKEFALIVQLETGEEKTYTSQSLTPWQPRIFGERFRQEFRRSARRTANDATYSGSAHQAGSTLFPEFAPDENPRFSSSGDSSSGGRSRYPYQRQSRSDDSDGTDSGKGKRKRVRGQYSSFDNDDTPVPVPVMKAHQITIGNEAEVEEFYVTRFKEMQQSSCKVMGKIFVKLVEPKKQTHHPYTRGDEKAPPWWPKTTGEDHVRHREPDHLLRPERIRLLVHILRMVVEPFHSQCDAVRKSGLNVQKLEDATMEAMSSWFNDTEHRGNLAKKPFLKEIFKVAKAEERYKNGEIDRDTRIPVMYGDRIGMEFSDDETEEGVKDEEEEIDTTQIPANVPTPESVGSQSIMQPQSLQQAQEHEPNNVFMGAPRPPLMRYHSQPVLEEHSSYPNPSFLPRTLGSGGGFQTQSPNQQDPVRRSFGSPVFPSPQSMYGWQNTTMAGNGPLSSSYYVTSAQTTLSAPGGPFQLPPPPTTQQPMLPPMAQHHFDTLPTMRPFDSGPSMGSMVRTGSLGHPHQLPHGFQNYLQDSGYGNNESDTRVENQQLHHP